MLSNFPREGARVGETGIDSHVHARESFRDVHPPAADPTSPGHDDDRTQPHLRVVTAPADDATLRAQVDAGLDATREVLRRYLTDRRDQAGHVAHEYLVLWETVAAQVGGKLLRPRLTVAAYLGLGGTDLAAVAPVAAAQELLHTAMLVHDDVLDGDEVRRGVPNVAGTYRARLRERGVVGRAADHQVLGSALLGGDLALSGAFDLVATAPVGAEVRVQVVRLLATTLATTVAGELLDVGGELLAPSDVDPLLVAELKTAAYTCCAPLQAGALLAHAPAATHATLDRVGTALGIAFQLADDDLGVFGDPAVTGKSVHSDLRAGTRTELLRYAYLLADDAGRAVLDRHVGDPGLDDAGAARVRDVMVGSGARDHVLALASAAARSARETAARHLPPVLAGYLGGVVDELAERGK
ncbi:polyprenyl synthetase family protein [Cellulomonas sp. NPDC055163]